MQIYQDSIIQVTETHTERSRSEVEGTGERSKIVWSRHFGFAQWPPIMAARRLPLRRAQLFHQKKKFHFPKI